MNPQEKGWCYLGPENRWTLSIFNVKSWEETLTSDSTKTTPYFLKQEIFQMTLSLAEIQICFLLLFFSKTESMFEITHMKSYLENIFPKRKDLILHWCITSDRLSHSLHSARLSNAGYMLQVSWWDFTLLSFEKENDSCT